MRTQLVLAVQCLLAWMLCANGLVLGEDPVDFSRDIRPLLNKHCTACHGGVKTAGDVSFITADSILPPSGWVVQRGNPDASILIERVLSDDPDIRMPPPDHGSALSSQDVDLLRRWIQQGATWRGHWAYETPARPELPKVSDSNWPRQSLDNFVLARLDAEGIAPAADERPERWLRRVCLDLTGLPPSMKDRQSFLDDLTKRDDLAYAAVVDRLLNSPAYGERWASVWLDQVRYADSRGLGLDGPRNIWLYRDWVINAFNKDMPYSDFTIKQMAGDLLPNGKVDDRVATAVHRLTQSNEEGGTDDEEFRIAAVMDRVSTTWQTWMGVTFSCVQCHGHPYDPFSHEDYYRFAAFFNNTRDCDLDDDWPTVQGPIDFLDVERASELDRQISGLRNQVWSDEFAALHDDGLWKPVQSMQAATNNATQVVVQAGPERAEYRTVDTVSRGTEFRLTVDMPEDLTQLTAIRFTGMPLDPEKARVDSEWGFVLSHVQASWIIPGQEQAQPIELAYVVGDEAEPYYDPQESLNAKSTQGFASFSRINYPRTAAFVLKQPEKVPAGAKLEVKLSNNVFILSAFPLVARRGHLALTGSQLLTELATGDKFTQRRQQLRDLIDQRKKIPSTSVPVLVEREQRIARPTHVFTRGLFLNKGDEVTPGTPASLPPLPDNRPADRLALAEWLVRDDNPLTARVAVNRVWAQLFGIGIVASEEDFGSSGDTPSHPQLLDFLALRFQREHGYSFKSLLRELVLSRTYRQSSSIRPELIERDADNRLLARGPRHRLTAEMIRDVSLASAGLLSDRVGGPPVRPPIPEGVWQPFVAWDKWVTPTAEQPDRYRRSIYTYTKRSIPYPIMASFDAPSREFCSPRRLRSNTPQQALTMLNDQTFLECATALAGRMQAAHTELREQIRHGFLLVTCRQPCDDEIAELVSLVNSHPVAIDRENAVAPEGVTPAALIAVARVLLNLDEVIMK